MDAPAAPDFPGPAGPPSGERILIATGDPQVIAAASPLLTATGYELVVLDNGPDVLLYADEHAADLYLLDHNLAQLDGLRVARHLHQSYNVPRERVIILYPADVAPSYQAEIQAGEILVCPFTGVELILCVMRHLHPASPEG
ncbi:MAG TPA: response regulator [Chloroflexia bacterium]|nr:response regulator [Chloroflexia bacterium]